MSTNHQSTDGGRSDPHGLPSHALYIGTDAEGSTHYYSRYDHVAWVVDGDDVDETQGDSSADGTSGPVNVERHDLDSTPVGGPGDWARHVYSTLEAPWQELLVGPYSEEDLAEIQEGVADRYGVDEQEVLVATLARRVQEDVAVHGMDIEAAITREIEAVDEPVDSEEVLQAYAERYGGS